MNDSSPEPMSSPSSGLKDRSVDESSGKLPQHIQLMSLPGLKTFHTISAPFPRKANLSCPQHPKLVRSYSHQPHFTDNTSTPSQLSNSDLSRSSTNSTDVIKEARAPILKRRDSTCSLPSSPFYHYENNLRTTPSTASLHGSTDEIFDDPFSFLSYHRGRKRSTYAPSNFRESRGKYALSSSDYSSTTLSRGSKAAGSLLFPERDCKVSNIGTFLGMKGSTTSLQASQSDLSSEFPSLLSHLELNTSDTEPRLGRKELPSYYTDRKESEDQDYRRERKCSVSTPQQLYIPVDIDFPSRSCSSIGRRVSSPSPLVLGRRDSSSSLPPSHIPFYQSNPQDSRSSMFGSQLSLHPSSFNRKQYPKF